MQVQTHLLRARMSFQMKQASALLLNRASRSRAATGSPPLPRLFTLFPCARQTDTVMIFNSAPDMAISMAGTRLQPFLLINWFLCSRIILTVDGSPALVPPTGETRLQAARVEGAKSSWGEWCVSCRALLPPVVIWRGEGVSAAGSASAPTDGQQLVALAYSSVQHGTVSCRSECKCERAHWRRGSTVPENSTKSRV